MEQVDLNEFLATEDQEINLNAEYKTTLNSYSLSLQEWFQEIKKHSRDPKVTQWRNIDIDQNKDVLAFACLKDDSGEFVSLSSELETTLTALKKAQVLFNLSSTKHSSIDKSYEIINRIKQLKHDIGNSLFIEPSSKKLTDIEKEFLLIQKEKQSHDEHHELLAQVADSLQDISLSRIVLTLKEQESQSNSEIIKTGMLVLKIIQDPKNCNGNCDYNLVEAESLNLDLSTKLISLEKEIDSISCEILLKKILFKSYFETSNAKLKALYDLTKSLQTICISKVNSIELINQKINTLSSQKDISFNKLLEQIRCMTVEINNTLSGLSLQTGLIQQVKTVVTVLKDIKTLYAQMKTKLLETLSNESINLGNPNLIAQQVIHSYDHTLLSIFLSFFCLKVNIEPEKVKQCLVNCQEVYNIHSPQDKTQLEYHFSQILEKEIPGRLQKILIDGINSYIIAIQRDLNNFSIKLESRSEENLGELMEKIHTNFESLKTTKKPSN